MKNFFIIFTFLFFSKLNYGQIAVIKDNDGFTNVRKLPNSDSEIIYKLKDSEIFSYQETESDWITVNISKNKYHLQSDNNDILVGYIHKSRLCPIEELNIYKGSEFSFKYELKEFTLENKICDFDGKWLIQINGRNIYGTDGDVPKTEVNDINVSVNGIAIDISSILFEDIFECDNNFIINKNEEDYIVHQWNSDGAGAYLIVWVFGKEKLKQRFILLP